jgi:hypothetical protein
MGWGEALGRIKYLYTAAARRLEGPVVVYVEGYEAEDSDVEENFPTGH